MILPWPFTRLALAFWPFVLLPLPLWWRWARGAATIPDEAVIAHEREHLKREWAYGPIAFGLRYFSDRQFRLNEELAAIRVEMAFLRSRGFVYDVQRKAQQFSSHIYGYMVSYDEARTRLSALWDTVGE